MLSSWKGNHYNAQLMLYREELSKIIRNIAISLKTPTLAYKCTDGNGCLQQWDFHESLSDENVSMINFLIAPLTTFNLSWISRPFQDFCQKPCSLILLNPEFLHLFGSSMMFLIEVMNSLFSLVHWQSGMHLEFWNSCALSWNLFTKIFINIRPVLCTCIFLWIISKNLFFSNCCFS